MSVAVEHDKTQSVAVSGANIGKFWPNNKQTGIFYVFGIKLVKENNYHLL